MKAERKKKGRDWLRMAYIAGGVLVMCLGFIAALQWGQNRANVFLAMLTILLWPAGGYLILRGIRHSTTEAVIVGAKKATGKLNSLNIYARNDSITGKVVVDRVAFENIRKPLGQPMQCLNDSAWYFIHIFDLATQKLVPFTLPDAVFFDPLEFSNVLTMPAHRRLFERKISLMQKVAPWIMLVALVASIIGLVAVSPQG